MDRTVRHNFGPGASAVRPLQPAAAPTTPAHGGDLEAAQIQFGGDASRWIDFSNSINPWGLPDERLRALMSESVSDLRVYPDPAYRRLRAALAAYHDIEPECIWPFHGSVAALYAIANLYAGRRALAPAPSFREYKQAADANGLLCDEPRFWRPTSSVPARADAIDAWSTSIPRDGLVILGHPNSPTGSILDEEQLDLLQERIQNRGSLLVLDEAFLPFVADETAVTRLFAASKSEGLVVLRSLTKSHGLPGIRLGYAVAAPPLIERLRAVSPPWSVTPLASRLAAELPSLAPMIREQLAMLREETSNFYERLSALKGLVVHPSCCNFFLCAVTAAGLDAPVLRERLARRCLLIRDCSDYPGLTRRHIRIAVRRPEENAVLLDALREELVPKDHRAS